MPRHIFILLAMLLAIPAWAQPPAEDAPAAEEGEALEPTVTIREDKRGRVEEYRRGGQLYMIKVIPKKGLPYFLVDADGDGVLDSRRNDLEPDVMIPSWVLFRW